jgi:hypothetical protein
MKEIRKLALLSANPHRAPFQNSIVLSILIGLLSAGCTVSRTIKTEVPQKILSAKTASADELLGLIQKYDKINSLSSSLDITYFSGKKESGIIREIRKQPGYILLKRSDSTHLVVQNFVSKLMELEVLSVGDELSIWIKRQGNKLYLGKNSAKELIAEDTPDAPGFAIPIRGGHIFEAVFPQGIKIDAPGILYSKDEQADNEAKYYILGFYREGTGHRIHTDRRIWIERSTLTIARQQVYMEDGRLVSDITYSNVSSIDGIYLPLRINIDRPLDGYALRLEFKNWRINPDLADNAFVLTPHSGAQIIHLKEKAF